MNVPCRCSDEKGKNIMAVGRILRHSIKKASKVQSNDSIVIDT